MTCGEGEVIRRIVVHMDPAMESKMTNVHYTVLSRVRHRADLAIASTESISLEFMNKLGNYKIKDYAQKSVITLSQLRNIISY